MSQKSRAEAGTPIANIGSHHAISPTSDHVHNNNSVTAGTWGTSPMYVDYCLCIAGLNLLTRAPSNSNAISPKEDFFVRKYFCKAFGSLRTDIPTDDPFRELYDNVDTSLLDASECEELFTHLSVGTERLFKSINPIYMSNISESLLYIGPRCLWCYRTEAHLMDTSQLIRCGACVGATYCSDDHREKAETTHKAQVAEDGQREVYCLIISMTEALKSFLK
jgi:hypothetical protein